MGLGVVEGYFPCFACISLVRPVFMSTGDKVVNLFTNTSGMSLLIAVLFYLLS